MKIKLTDIPAYYINLPHHTDKNEKMQSMLSECGFKSIIRLDGYVYPENPIAGCSRAHYHAISSNTTPFILFEDDAFLLENQFQNELEIPDAADALYLGTSTWGRMNGHNGEYIQYDVMEDYPGILRVYNILATHAILYLSSDYAHMISRVAHHTGYVIEDYNDVGFAEVQRYFNVYALDHPMFAQSSNIMGTDKSITSICHTECMTHDPLQFYPYKLK